MRLVTCLMTVRTSLPLGVVPCAGSPPPAYRSRHDRCASGRSRARRGARSKTPAAGRHGRRRTCRRCRASPACPASPSRRTDQAARRQPPCRGLARRILQTRDGRLRRQRRPGLRTAANRDLHQRIMPQPVEVDSVLIAARNRRRARHHHLEHRVPHPVRIAAIRHRLRKPPAHLTRGPEMAARSLHQGLARRAVCRRHRYRP